MLIVIGCGQEKAPAPAPAADLYVGTQFRLALRWARSHVPDSSIVVLSARYGFVALDDVIAPYDTRMGDRDAITGTALRASATRMRIYHAEHVIVAAGRGYFDAARGVWPGAEWAFADLPDKRIGFQRQWLVTHCGPREVTV